MAFKNLTIEDMGEILNDTGYGTAVDDADFVQGGGFHEEIGFATGGPTLFALGKFFGEGVPANLKKQFPEVLDQVGRAAVAECQRMIDEGYPPWTPLSPFTIEQKGFDQILYETGILRDSFDYEVDKVGLAVRLFSNDPKLIYSELGTSKEPARPILEPAMMHVVGALPKRLGRSVEVSFVQDAEHFLGAGVVTSEGLQAEQEIAEPFEFEAVETTSTLFEEE